MADDGDDEIVGQVLQMPSPGRGAPDQATGASRRLQAVTLRLAGMTYVEIAGRLGYASHSAVREAVINALTRLETESATELRTMENTRLDRAQAAIWPKVIAGELPAINTYLKISERRARLNGMDRPQEVILTPGTNDVQQWVADVLTATGAAPDVDEADVVDVEWIEDPGTDDGEPT